jgi:hypothetical protein
MIEVTLQGDSTSGVLQGVLSRAMVNNTATTVNTAITHGPTGVAFNNEPPLQFAVGCVPSANGTKSVLDSLLLES